MSSTRPKTCAVIAAAGQSTRMCAPGSKQFIEIGGKTVIEKTIAVFDSCPYIDEIIVAARAEDIEKIREIAAGAGFSKLKNIVAGGQTRRESVASAVAAVSGDMDFIAIHDGARCFVTHGDIEKVLFKAFETGAAAAGTKVTDTIKTVGVSGKITGTPARELLWAVQTPQIFAKDLYIEALGKCESDVTDDCAVAEGAGYTVCVVECSRYNIKITDAQDLEFVKGLL